MFADVLQLMFTQENVLLKNPTKSGIKARYRQYKPVFGPRDHAIAACLLLENLPGH